MTGLTPSQHYWTETAACWLVDDLMALPTLAEIEAMEALLPQVSEGGATLRA